MLFSTRALAENAADQPARAERAARDVTAPDVIVLDVSGPSAASFVAVAHELLGRIHVRVQSRIEAVDGGEAALLDVSVRIAGSSGGFVARRPADGRIVASAEMSFETAELLREALAHSLLSLVDAVKQGQPVPSELQQTVSGPAPEAGAPKPPKVSGGVAVPSAAPPSHPALAPKLPRPVSSPPRLPPVANWRLTVAAASALMDASHPDFGGLLRGERRVTDEWAFGGALGYSATRQFSAQGYRVELSRVRLQVHAARRIVELTSPATSVLLVPAIGINGEGAEALSGDGALSGRQTKWLPNFGAAARLRHDVGAVSLEAELGVRAFPRAPRLVVIGDERTNSLFEPWSVQPELTLGVGVSF